MLKVLEIALGEVGYLEKASNADLDSKTGNAGFANYTKYARDLDKLGDFYNTPKQGYPWCEVFVDWCMVKAYGQAMALTLLCQPKKSAGAGCTQSASYYKQKGQFYTSPKVGDQVFFTWGGADGITGRATWDRLHGFTLYADNRPVITITESGLTIERR